MRQLVAGALEHDRAYPEVDRVERETRGHDAAPGLEGDVRAMSAVPDEVFGDPVPPRCADALLRRLATGDGMELWVAEVDGRVIGAATLERSGLVPVTTTTPHLRRRSPVLQP